MNVFVSYRRNDSTVHARLIAAELGRRFGDDAVFMDIEDIPYGGDFAAAIDAQLARCEAVVAVIGPRWAATLRERLGEEDYVRHELARAYALGRRVVPVLVGGAAPPPADALPPGLAPLATTNMLVLDERYLLAHVNALLEALQGESFERVAGRLAGRVRTARRMNLAAAAAALAMFFAAWTALFDFLGIDTRVATLTMRLGRLGAPAPWSGQVVVAGIDDASGRRVGRPFDATWRGEHARLIGRAAGAGARVVAFDLFLATAGRPADDDALEAAIGAARRAGTTVVFGVADLGADGVPALLPRFAAAGASWGLACAGERLGAARSMLAAVDRDPRRLSSLALAAYSGGGAVEAIDAAAREVRVRVPRDERSVDVPYSHAETVRREHAGCPALGRGDRAALQLLDPAALPALDAPPRRWSYAALLDADDAVLRAALQGRILLVGVQLAGRDVKALPGVPGGRRERHGVELVAAQIDAMLRGTAIRPLGATGDFLTMLLAGFAGAAGQRAAAGWSAARRALLAAAIVLGFVALCALLYRTRLLLPAVPYGVVAIALAWWAMRLSEAGWPWRGAGRARRAP